MVLSRVALLIDQVRSREWVVRLHNAIGLGWTIIAALIFLDILSVILCYWIRYAYNTIIGLNNKQISLAFSLAVEFAHASYRLFFSSLDQFLPKTVLVFFYWVSLESCGVCILLLVFDFFVESCKNLQFFQVAIQSFWLDLTIEINQM